MKPRRPVSAAVKCPASSRIRGNAIGPSTMNGQWIRAKVMLDAKPDWAPAEGRIANPPARLGRALRAVVVALGLEKLARQILNHEPQQHRDGTSTVAAESSAPTPSTPSNGRTDNAAVAGTALLGNCARKTRGHDRQSRHLRCRPGAPVAPDNAWSADRILHAARKLPFLRRARLRGCTTVNGLGLPGSIRRRALCLQVPGFGCIPDVPLARAF